MAVKLRPATDLLLAGVIAGLFEPFEPANGRFEQAGEPATAAGDG